MAWPRWLVNHPTVVVAVKAGVASGLAFFLGSLLPAPLGEYKYYAALGAFTVIGLIVVDSVKESLQVLAAVSIGVGVAFVIQLVAWTNPVSIAAAVLVCVLLGALPALGEQRTWAPLAALFVLATGGADPKPIALGYLIQLPLGATVGILVNLVLLPPLGVQDLDRAARTVRLLVAQHLRAYADFLEDELEEPLENGEGGQRDGKIMAHLQEMERAQSSLLVAIAESERAQRANPRARGWADTEELFRQQAETISTCAATLGAVGVMLKQSDPPEGKRGQMLRRDAANVLRRAADVFDDPERARRDVDLLANAQASVEAMIRESQAVRVDEGLDHVLFGALAISIRNCLTVFAREVAGRE